MTPSISPDLFFQADLRVGTVVDAREFPEARKPAVQLVIDFGPEIGQMKSSAQITANYSPQDLVGRQVIAVVNFPPRQIGPFMSECLVLGASDSAEGIVLLAPERPVPNGSRIA